MSVGTKVQWFVLTDGCVDFMIGCVHCVLSTGGLVVRGCDEVLYLVDPSCIVLS